MENVPQETETIAVKRSVRISRKLDETRRHWSSSPAWWSNGISEVFALLFIFVLNVILIMPLFGRQIPDVPFSGPVIPFFVNIFELVRFSHQEAVSIVIVAMYLIFPFSFYLMVRWITRRKFSGFMAAMFASLPLFPFAQPRIFGGFIGLDAPHVASLAIVPIALYGILSFSRNGGVKNLVIASFFSALIALTSPFSFLAFCFFAGVATFSEMLLGLGRLKIMRLMVVILFAAGLCSFWYHPSFFAWMITGPLGIDVRNVLDKLLPTSFFLAPVLGVFGFLLFDRRESLQPLFLAIFSTAVFALIVMAGGGLVPSHPGRYTAELGIAVSLFLGVVVTMAVDAIRNGKIRFGYLKPSLVANFSMAIIIVMAMAGILLGRLNMDREEQVLGIWTDVNKGEIWQARDRFNGVSAIIGYSISAVSSASLIYLVISTKKVKLQNSTT